MIYFIGNKTLFERESIESCSLQEAIDYFSDKQEIQVDSETLGFDPYTKRLLTIQTGDNENQFVIENTGNFIKLKELLESKLLIFHNAKFDLRFLYHQGIYPRKVFDTYIAECIITQGLQSRKSLQFVAEKYLKVNLDKSIRGVIHKEGMTDRVITYAAEDVRYLQQIKEFQLREVYRQQRERDLNIQNQFTRVLAYIEYCGMKLDYNKWKSKCNEDKINLTESEDILNKELLKINHPEYSRLQGDLFGEAKPSVNWMSPKQIIPIFKFLGVDTKVKDKKGKISDSIEEVVLSKYKKLPFIKLYLEYRKAEKVCGTYGETFFKHINPESNRIHTSYRQLVDSGRTSSGGKDKDNGMEYINFQNLPREKRTKECFIPEDKNKLVICDYTAQEMCVFVNQSLEPKMLEFFNSGEDDMHSFIAEKVFPELKGLSLKEIKKNHSELRYKAKQGGFAILYGGTPYAIANQFDSTVEEAQKFYDGYFESFTEVKKFFKNSSDQAFRDGFIEIDNLTGAKYFIGKFWEYKKLKEELGKDGFWDNYRVHKNNDDKEFRDELKPKVSKYFSLKGEIERKSVNYRIQGISALISKVAGYLYLDWIIDNNLQMIVKIPAFVHDEYVAEAPIEVIEEAKENLERCMIQAGTYWCKTISLKADAKITDNWGDK